MKLGFFHLPYRNSPHSVLIFVIPEEYNWFINKFGNYQLISQSQFEIYDYY